MIKGLIKGILIGIIVGLLIVSARGCIAKSFRPLPAYEGRFGKLTPYVPEVTFAHFKSTKGYQVDFLYHKKSNTYQYLAKGKIK